MKLNKKCSCCQIEITTKNSYAISSHTNRMRRKTELGLWINCKACQSTLLLTSYDIQAKALLGLFEQYRKNAKKVG